MEFELNGSLLFTRQTTYNNHRHLTSVSLATVIEYSSALALSQRHSTLRSPMVNNFNEEHIFIDIARSERSKESKQLEFFSEK